MILSDQWNLPEWSAGLYWRRGLIGRGRHRAACVPQPPAHAKLTDSDTGRDTIKLGPQHVAARHVRVRDPRLRQDNQPAPDAFYDHRGSGECRAFRDDPVCQSSASRRLPLLLCLLRVGSGGAEVCIAS